MRQSRKGMWLIIAGSLTVLFSTVMAIWPHTFNDNGNGISAFIMVFGTYMIFSGAWTLIGPK